MNMENAQKLTRIYNTLLMVKTSGEDTILMGKCLEVFKTFMSEIEITSEEVANIEQEE